MKVAIVLMHGVEEVEYVTCVDLLRRAEIVVDVFSVETSLSVRGSHDILLKADDNIEKVKNKVAEYEIIILPGGPGVKNLLNCQKLKDIILDFHKKGKKIAAICAAPKLLDKLNLLKDELFVCHPSVEMEMTKKTGDLSEKTLVSGDIVTSRGLGTAIDFSLKIIEILKNKQISDKIKKQIAYE